MSISETYLQVIVSLFFGISFLFFIRNIDRFFPDRKIILQALVDNLFTCTQEEKCHYTFSLNPESELSPIAAVSILGHLKKSGYSNIEVTALSGVEISADYPLPIKMAEFHIKGLGKPVSRFVINANWYPDLD